MADNEVFELGADDLPARVQPTAIAAHGHRLARYLHPCGPAHPSGRSQCDRSDSFAEAPFGRKRFVPLGAAAVDARGRRLQCMAVSV